MVDLYDQEEDETERSAHLYKLGAGRLDIAMLKAKEMEPHVDSMRYSLALDECDLGVSGTHVDCNCKSQFVFLKLCFRNPFNISGMTAS